MQRVGVGLAVGAHGGGQRQVLGGGLVVAAAGEGEAEAEVGVVVGRGGLDDRAEVGRGGLVLAGVELGAGEGLADAARSRLGVSRPLQDLGGGRVSAVSYDSQAPIDKTLRSFAIDLTSNPTFGQILNQGRGEKVEVVLQQSNATQPGTMTGTILGVEKQKQQVGKDGSVEVEMLNLWCAEGIRSVKLSEVQRLRFLNPVMDSEVKKALEVLSLSHDTQKKAVSLAFAGEGKRAVKVGYVVENPIWKTSYRLVLDKKGKPFLLELD